MSTSNRLPASFIRPLAPARTFEQILYQLEEAAATRRLRAGDRLPSERDLSEQLGVSRTSLREAVRVLEALGIVSVRRGAEYGVTVRAEPGNPLSDILRFHLALEHVSVDDLVEFRLLLETWATGVLAKRRRTAGVVAELGGLVDAMEDVSPERFNELDAEFHLAIVRGTQNRLASLIAGGARAVIERTILESLIQTDSWPTLRSRLVSQHRAIVASIRNGDAVGAAALAEQHIRDHWSANLSERQRGA